MDSQIKWSEEIEKDDLSHLDKRTRWTINALKNAEKDPGSFISSQILGDSRKRAKNNNWDYDLDWNYLVSLWYSQKGLCAKTGVPMTGKSGSQKSKNPYRASLDRIDNSKGYVKGNVRFVTHWYNNAKSTWSDEVFDDFVTNIVENLKSK